MTKNWNQPVTEKWLNMAWPYEETVCGMKIVTMGLRGDQEVCSQNMEKSVEQDYL